MKLVSMAALVFLWPLLLSVQAGSPQHLQPAAEKDSEAQSVDQPARDQPVVRIELAPEATSEVSQPATIVAVLTATQIVVPVNVEVIAGGGVRAVQPAGSSRVIAGTSYFRNMPNRDRYILRIPALTPEESVRLRISVTSSAVDGFLAVTVSSASSDDFSENSTLFLGRMGGRLITSGGGLLDLRRQRLIFRAQTQGPNFMAPAKTLEEALIELEQQGSARPNGAVEPLVPTPPQTTQPEVAVTGRIEFTDIGGRRHPVGGVEVEIRDEDAADDDDVLATVQTDDRGQFSSTVVNSDEDGTGADLHAVAYTRGSLVVVTQFTAEADGSFPAWSIRSAEHPNVTTGPIDLSITASNDEAQFPNAAAFEVYEATATLARYVQSLEGGTAPALSTVRYPEPSDSSYYDVGLLHVGLTDAHDWDNIMHEYGHRLQSIYGFASDVGGSHYGTENHCQVKPTRAKGLQMAWSESWPTFFALQAQASVGLGVLGIPDLADATYHDRKPGKDTVYDLEVPDIDDASPPSEGQEHAVQRVTWDMFDSADDVGDTGVALDPARLWTAAKASTSGRFAAFWQALSQPLSDGERGGLGEILALHRIGPTTDPVTPPTNGTAQRLTWQPLLGCSGGGQIRYRLRFWDPDGGANLLETPFQTTTSFTLSPAQLNTLFPQGRDRVAWTVVARDLAAPQTGDYPGSSRFFDRVH